MRLPHPCEQTHFQAKSYNIILYSLQPQQLSTITANDKLLQFWLGIQSVEILSKKNQLLTQQPALSRRPATISSFATNITCLLIVVRPSTSSTTALHSHRTQQTKLLIDGLLGTTKDQRESEQWCKPTSKKKKPGAVPTRISLIEYHVTNLTTAHPSQLEVL